MEGRRARDSTSYNIPANQLINSCRRSTLFGVNKLPRAYGKRAARMHGTTFSWASKSRFAITELLVLGFDGIDPPSPCLTFTYHWCCGISYIFDYDCVQHISTNALIYSASGSFKENISAVLISGEAGRRIR